MTLSGLPADDELEISVFGPGVGESIILHVGGGKWTVVDSCLDPESRQPIALKYLRQLGVALENVVAIIATHWHDDHTKGLAEIVRQCTRAEFFCSTAVREEEFLSLVAAAPRLQLKTGLGSGVDEMYDVLTYLAETKRPVSFRAENQIIYRSSDPVSCQIEALSPSSTSQLRALLALAPKAFEAKGAIPNPGPNELSVALHVSFGQAGALLGADLETGSSDKVGWRAIVRNPLNTHAAVGIVKVPHHGSAGADHEPAWAKLVAPQAHLAVTPFNSSSLPKDTDVARLKSRSANVFHASPGRRKKAQLDKATERTLGDIKIFERSKTMGRIRFRARATGEIVWDLDGAAKQL